MKTILFLITLLFAGNTASITATRVNNIYKNIELIVNNDDRDIKKDKDIDPENTPRTRGLMPQPVYAYLYNNELNIDFTKDFPIAIITIINETTGEIIYSESSNCPFNINIDLNNEIKGSYSIKIEVNDTYVTGLFSL